MEKYYRQKDNEKAEQGPNVNNINAKKGNNVKKPPGALQG